jgi:hypothetical protein
LPSTGNTIRNIGPNKAAPPIPEEIEHIATQTHVGNINQYFEKSINEITSENVVTLVTAAVNNDVELDEMIGSTSSGFKRSKMSAELDNVATFLTRAG